MFHGCVASNIAATPQGGSDLICNLIVFEGNRCIRYRSFAHPLAMLPEPRKGVLSNEWLSQMTELLNFRTSELLKSLDFLDHRTPLGVPVS